MAYIGQDKKKMIAAELKQALKGTGLKYTLGIHHHAALVVNIKSGPVDFLQNYIDTVSQTPQVLARPDLFQKPEKYIQVNNYWYHEQFTGKALELLKTMITICNKGNHDHSDIQTDYFDVGWYLNVNIGKWDKPYQVTK